MTKHRPRLHLDMPFGEALKRFAGVDPDQVNANIKRAKKRKAPGGKKVPPGGDNVVSLRVRRVRKRNTGR
jgi:hypothetical protein